MDTKLLFKAGMEWNAWQKEDDDKALNFYPWFDFFWGGGLELETFNSRRD